MSTDKKLFTIAGTSVHNGEMSVRVATGKISVREGVLRRNEHTDIKLFELPNPMTRADASAYIETLNGNFPLPAPKEPKVKKEKVAKAAVVEAEEAVVEVPVQNPEDKAAAARERKNAARRAQRAAAKEALAA